MRPAAVTSPSTGTARRAALGDSTSSNRGTGSPRRSWSGPSGQSPLFAVTNAPSATSVTTARRSQRSRRPVRAHHQTWTMAPRNATAIAPWPARKARAAGDNRPLAMLARMASAAYFVQTRGYRFLLLGGPAIKVSGRSGEVGVGVVAHFSFGADGADCSWELSRLLNSMRGRQAARKQRELAETGAPPRGRLGLKGSSRERTCQAAIRTLRGDGRHGRVLAVAGGEQRVENVPGVAGSPSLVGGLDGGPATDR